MAVIGLGAMGSATAYQLAKLGAKVVGIDQYTPPHALGSTHGETRITREAIGEGVQFVPLARRSHQLWRELEAQTAQTLLTTCGGLILAHEGQRSQLHAQSDFLGNTIRAAEAFGISHQRLNANEIATRFPQFASLSLVSKANNNGRNKGGLYARTGGICPTINIELL